jgi:hypothetical protein
LLQSRTHSQSLSFVSRALIRIGLFNIFTYQAKAPIEIVKAPIPKIRDDQVLIKGKL